jgi:hypothetical protein
MIQSGYVDSVEMECRMSDLGSALIWYFFSSGIKGIDDPNWPRGAE